MPELPPAPSRPVRWWLRSVIFLCLIGIAGAPWASRDAAFSGALSAIGNACFGSVPLLPARLELQPVRADHERAASENVHTDTQVVLHVPGRAGAARLG